MNHLLHILWRGLKETLHICQLELSVILHDQGVFIFAILVPLGYPLLYSYIYSTELMREVPSAIVDQSHSALSREFARKMDASQWTRVKGYCSDVADAHQQLKEQRIYGFILLPSDFSTNIQTGRQAYVGAYADMAGMLYYKAVLLAATDVSLDMNKEIKIARAGNYTDREDAVTAYPVRSQEVALFNSTQGFACFLIPAVLMLIIQQTLLLSIGMSGGTAAEDGRYRDLIITSRRNRGTLHIITGRGLAYFFVYSITATYIACVVPHIFDLVEIGRPFDLFIFLLPYILSCIFFALTLSVLMRNREMSILIIVVTSVPLLFASGISWPGSAIPPFWKGVSYLFPSTFGINGYTRIMTMGARIEQVLPEWYALWIQTIVYFTTAYITCRYLIHREEKEVK